MMGMRTKVTVSVMKRTGMTMTTMVMMMMMTMMTMRRKTVWVTIQRMKMITVSMVSLLRVELENLK